MFLKKIFFKDLGLVVQLVRIRACHARGHGFDSRSDRLKLQSSSVSVPETGIEPV